MQPIAGRYDSNVLAFSSVEIGMSHAKHFLNTEKIMLGWTLIFLVIALVAGLLGFTGIAGAAVGIARILFVIFLVLFLVALIARLA